MTYPSVVEVTKLQESAASSSHSLQGFADVQAGDTLYAVFALSTMVSPTVADSWEDTSPSMVLNYWQYKIPNSTGKNNALTIVRAILPSATGSGNESGNPLTIATGGARVCAAVGVQLRGAGTAPLPGGANKDEQLPDVDTNPNKMKAPGIVAAQESRVPQRTSNTSAGVDSKVIASFGRVGSTAWNTGINDDIGGGISDGAPYLAEKWEDLKTPLGIGGNTSPFAVLDHAESTDGSWKVQAAMAHRDIASALWAGHDWGHGTPLAYVGQVQLTYWPCNGMSGSTLAAPTGILGLRVRGS